ncbi:sensor histidine kinase [Sporichthya polymorpha]|uniref:sensor histidine kinase n=1 Tax=Sporichthya polymorpha TaxID=35751 RepID=UPI00035FA258|nr:sensor histidine kinase [Sporichthya polymorpha]
MSQPTTAEPTAADFARRGGLATLRLLALAVVAPPVALVLFALTVVSLALIPALGIGLFVVPWVAALNRSVTDFLRRLGPTWFGGTIDRPYKPAPILGGPIRKAGWVLGDPATWRDLLWLLWTATLGFALVLLPVALVGQGIYGWVLTAGVWRPIYENTGGEWYAFIKVTSWSRAFGAGLLGTSFVLLGLTLAPYVLRLSGAITRSLLAPTKEQALRRVSELTETRSTAVDVSAAEIRRIERDLHDGAQARLVAMGMSLGAAEHLMDSDPERAKAMIAEARTASVAALNELRDLVRGILPPVLAERGLGDAVRALALASPAPTEVTVTLPTRLPDPVESAAYFAVSEALTNAIKHARASRIWIDLRHDGQTLRITVGDDGRGGADPTRGTGLAGVAKRLSTFDGRIDVASPTGGPTIVTMEVPAGAR